MQHLRGEKKMNAFPQPLKSVLMAAERVQKSSYLGNFDESGVVYAKWR